eukprot:COSAG02_NODE_63386_length_263_cov_0.634146_1_plen_68_part_10
MAAVPSVADRHTGSEQVTETQKAKTDRQSHNHPDRKMAAQTDGRTDAETDLLGDPTSEHSPPADGRHA